MDIQLYDRFDSFELAAILAQSASELGFRATRKDVPYREPVSSEEGGYRTAIGQSVSISIPTNDGREVNVSTDPQETHVFLLAGKYDSIPVELVMRRRGAFGLANYFLGPIQLSDEDAKRLGVAEKLEQLKEQVNSVIASIVF